MRIVGYTFQADVHCPGCIRAVYMNVHTHGVSTEELLDIAAEAAELDRHDESSFDSFDFPKVVFECMLDGGEHCGTCGGEL